MDKTHVSVYFSLYGDEFPIDNVTERLELTPTNAYKKGDLINNSSTARYRKETSWDLETGYQASFDVNDQLQEIIDKIQNKATIINDIKADYSIDCKFFIVIKIEEGITPALYLSSDIIKFASSIGAEFDIDLYSNPFVTDLEN